MTSVSTPAYLERTPFYFYRLKEGENLDNVADKFKIPLEKLLAENSGVEPQPGEVVTINMKHSALT